MGTITNWNDGDALTPTEMNDTARAVFSQTGCPAAGSYAISGLNLLADQKYTLDVIGAHPLVAAAIRLGYNAITGVGSCDVINRSSLANYVGSNVIVPSGLTTNFFSTTEIISTDGAGGVPYYVSKGVYYPGYVFQCGGCNPNVTANVSSMWIIGSPTYTAFSVFLYKNKFQIS